MGAKEIVGENLARVLPQESKYWFQIPHLLKLNLILLIPFLSSAATGFDAVLMNGLQAETAWKNRFGNPQGSLLGLVNGAQTVGNLCALPFVIPLSDKFGRRWMIPAGAILIVVAAMIQMFSVNYGMFVAARGVIGFGSSLMVLPSPIIIAELAYPTHRGKYTSLFWCGFHLGSLIGGWSTYGAQKSFGGTDWAWRIPSVVQVALPLIQLSTIWMLPESPRWLIAKDRHQEARDILARHHAGGDRDDPLVLFEIAEINEALRHEKASADSEWKALVRTPGNRKRTLIAICVGCFGMWNGTTVMAVYLTLVLDIIGFTDPNVQTLINGVFSAWNFVMACTAAFTIDKLGRRTLFLWSTAGMLVSYIVWTVCSAVVTDTGSHAAGIVVLVFLYVYAFHYVLAYTPLLIGYPTEIFTYSMRAKGLALVLGCFQVSNLILCFVNPIGIENIGWKFYIVFCCILAFMFVVTWFLFPETRGHSLEEIAEVFDGKDAPSVLPKAVDSFEIAREGDMRDDKLQFELTARRLTSDE